MKLIYISNIRISLSNENTYQSFMIDETFSKSFESVEFRYPDIRNTEGIAKKDIV